ncbi:MAG: hypothetical protein RIC55_11370 [Pirellulaceae bacterium]
MKQSLRALLSGIIDYAGMFPPARLSAEETVHNYLEYRRGEHGWMLGKLVCAYDRLPTVLSLLDSNPLMERDAKVSLSLVIPSNESVHLDGLADVLRSKRVEDFLLRFAGRVAIASLELKLQRHSGRSWPPLCPVGSVFHEMSSNEDLRSESETFFMDIAKYYSDAKLKNRSPIGFKLRTGGLKAADFPSVEQTAFLISGCRVLRIPWKATAGLHQPLRRWDASIGVKMYGFLNLACASVLAATHLLQPSVIAEVLRDESIDNFTFDDDGFRWRDLEATISDIVHCRERGFQSFGSCSFEEPIEGLRQLGWL